MRATQFHELIATLLDDSERLPVAPLPLDFLFQPWRPREVAGRIADLRRQASPTGRADDFGGPEVLTLDEMAATVASAHGAAPAAGHACPIPGRVGLGFRAGRNTCPGAPRLAPRPGRSSLCRPDPAPVGSRRMTWLLCDYGEVLCLAPSAADRAALAGGGRLGPGPGRLLGRRTGPIDRPTTGPT